MPRHNNAPTAHLKSLALLLLLGGTTAAAAQDSADKTGISAPSLPRLLDEITIVGNANDVATTAGSAAVIDEGKLEQFSYTDVQRIVREIPGVSVQIEDGYGLRPNISIRGTASERSARITLLEDNVLIAPAPYSAPAAYYFPTVSRMQQVEVVKGSSAIKQGPYTIGGSMNFISTQIPESRAALIDLEAGMNATTRMYGAVGESFDNFGYLVEGQMWDSDGFQDIDFVNTNTGLDKDDWMLKLRFNSDSTAAIYQQFDIKYQYAKENSNQSYLGLTDDNFGQDAYRRYGASRLDNIDTEHNQLILRYSAEFSDELTFSVTGYINNHERNWFKTEGLDPDGSATAEQFERSSWLTIVQAVNNGTPVGGLTPDAMQAILDGGDSPIGSIQLRNNAREYYSRGVQFATHWNADFGGSEHEFEFGLRLHRDEEDRLQRNSNYHQENDELILDDLGLLGNAGNRVQRAEALSFFVYDQISLGKLTLTPGVRYEDIDQNRIRWETRAGLTNDPSSREPSNIRDTRENESSVWIPGIGALYSVNESFALYGGIHKGFSAPSNAPDVGEETSINYELGVRAFSDRSNIDAAVFFTDYDNLLGQCTSSSGADCEIGDAFNGDAASVLGVEVMLTHDFAGSGDYSIPFSLTYTWLDGTFDSDIADTDFFGDVSRGDPLPYIPDNQFLASIGWISGKWGSFLSANFVDETCVQASCGEFEKTDSMLTVDFSLNYQFNDTIGLYTRLENLTDENAIVSRHPYGARPNIGRTASIGVRIAL